MKLAALVMIAVAAAAILASRSGDPPSPQAEPAAPACDPELDAAFGAWADAGFSGTIAISSGGEFDCLAGYGFADASADTPNTVDTVFSIGSVSKAFTAAAIFKLVDDGKLSLGDRAGAIVPGLGGPVARATIEQLLLHTSGLIGSHGADYEPLGRDAAVAAIGRLRLAFEPGSDFLYSNAGHTLLALIVEEASGMRFRDYMASRILPLGGSAVAGGFWNGDPAAPGPRAVGHLDDGTTGEPGDFAGPYWATDGNGSLAMTTRDLARWTHALFTGRVVSPESADAIAAPGFDLGDGQSEAPGWVAFDEQLFGEPALASAGGGGDVGHNAVVAWLPETERVLAIASNTPGVTAEELLEAVAPALVEGDPLPRPDAPAGTADPSELAAAAGTYRLATGGRLAVTARKDGLAIAARGADAVAALFPLSRDSGFSARDVAAHEERVRALLAGETDVGRKERAGVESSVGPIDAVVPAGTIVDDGELRTYLTITSGDDSIALWYALDERGGIAAAQLGAKPPTLVVVPSGGGGYRPAAPTGAPDVTVRFRAGRMTIAGPDGSTRARPAA